jgi:hypothetical protein
VLKETSNCRRKVKLMRALCSCLLARLLLTTTYLQQIFLKSEKVRVHASGNAREVSAELSRRNKAKTQFGEWLMPNLLIPGIRPYLNINAWHKQCYNSTYGFVSMGNVFSSATEGHRLMMFVNSCRQTIWNCYFYGYTVSCLTLVAFLVSWTYTQSVGLHGSSGIWTRDPNV